MTVSNNHSSTDGGGIFVADTRSISLSSSTVARNFADTDAMYIGDGGGIAFGDGCTGFCALPRAYIENTIIADNWDLSPGGSIAHDCAGELSSEGYNLVEHAGTSTHSVCEVSGDLTGVIVGTDPAMAAIADNGGIATTSVHGPPWTHALNPGSPAINAGDPAGCRDDDGVVLPYDQRHAPRIGRCDLGAYEYGSTPSAGTVRWQLSSVDALENSGTLNLTIERIDGTPGAITVNWSTSNGSATAGSDYSAAGGSLPMASGETSAQVSVTLIDDPDLEGGEFFTLSIDSATDGAVVGAPAQLQVNILDDEDHIFADRFASP